MLTGKNIRDYTEGEFHASDVPGNRQRVLLMGRLLSEEEFSRQFTDFEHTAWKLEVRDRYNVPEEAETLRRFLDSGGLGRDEDHARTSSWHRNVTATTRQGKAWQRVRVVSNP